MLFCCYKNRLILQITVSDFRFPFFQNASGSPEDIKAFYEQHSAPLVGHIQSQTEKRFSKRPLIVVYYDVNFNHEYASSKFK